MTLALNKVRVSSISMQGKSLPGRAARAAYMLLHESRRLQTCQWCSLIKVPVIVTVRECNLEQHCEALEAWTMWGQHSGYPTVTWRGTTRVKISSTKSPEESSTSWSCGWWLGQKTAPPSCKGHGNYDADTKQRPVLSSQPSGRIEGLSLHYTSILVTSENYCCATCRYATMENRPSQGNLETMRPWSNVSTTQHHYTARRSLRASYRNSTRGTCIRVSMHRYIVPARPPWILWSRLGVVGTLEITKLKFNMHEQLRASHMHDK